MHKINQEVERQKLEKLAQEVDKKLDYLYEKVDKLAYLNHKKVLDAFQKVKVSDYHFKGTTGYGYHDPGREALEELYTRIFKTEAALVRGQIVSGTHALAICLYGLLRPGDELLFLQGRPYDTLEEIIGTRRGDSPGSLREMGVRYRQVDLTSGGKINCEAVKSEVSRKTKLVLLQRSCGYSRKPPLSVGDMEKIIKSIKTKNSDTLILVDNCYGEFVETREPTEVGADLAAGSLIKNPGGGLAPTGGYIVGKKKLVEMAASRWTAPGIGRDVGPVFEWQRLFFQGLFLAPHFVAEALKGAIFTARFFEELGFQVYPRYDCERTDIIQAVELGSRELLVAFCRGVQKGSPVDSHVRPEPWDMPGYDHQVVMAAGTFIQGASLELTADGPLRPPYVAFMQGGLSKEYVKLGVISAAQEVLTEKGYNNIKAFCN